MYLQIILILRSGRFIIRQRLVAHFSQGSCEKTLGF